MTVRDPEATKARILDAALEEFADKGISGARVDAIAVRAQVNKRMLYYYFGSKEGLFREILRSHLVRTAAQNAASDASSSLGRRARGLAKEPAYLRLLAWEALETMPTAPVNEEQRREFMIGWIDAVRREQDSGVIPADLDAVQLVLTEVCLVMGPMLIPQITRLVTGHLPTDPEFLDARTAFLDHLELHVGYCRPPSDARERA